MLRNSETLIGDRLDATDGEFGSVKEFYFDDQRWTIRHLVAETGTWMNQHQVLIPPGALVSVDTQQHRIATNLTKQQLEASPSLHTDKPVSRQFEESHYRHNESLAYESSFAPSTKPKSWNPFLRSTSDVEGHYLQATDGEIGHLDSFLLDTRCWSIRYLVIDTNNWWRSNKVLIAPTWIERLSWSESKVFVNMTCDAIRHLPEYTTETVLDPQYEARILQHHDQTA